MDGLIEGRMVHYVMPNGEHRPAVVTRVWSEGCCNLTVFPDLTNDGQAYATGLKWATSVGFSEEKSPNTWHWIERA